MCTNNEMDEKLIQPAMKKACPVLDTLLQAGFSAYFVGGSVRDTILGRPLHDIDIATSATPSQMLALFPHCIPTGLQHGTVTVLDEGQSYEITTFRAEYGYTDFRHPAKIAFVHKLEEDLQRRDFTINAMAIDRQWKLYDPFGGQKHLKDGLLATVGESKLRFQEDALRMLRAVRFAATYHLRMEQSCQTAIWEHGELLQYIAMERVAYELGRLLQAESIEHAVALLQKSKLLKHTKEKLHLANVTFNTQLQIATHGKEPIGWALLFMYSGLNHEEANQDMRALRLSNGLKNDTTMLLKLCEWFNGNQEELKLEKEWLNMLLIYPRRQLDLWLEHFALLGPKMVDLAQYHHQLPVKSVKELVVDGRQLLKWREQPGGAWVKKLQHELFILIAKGLLPNEKSHIENYVKGWKEG